MKTTQFFSSASKNKRLLLFLIFFEVISFSSEKIFANGCSSFTTTQSNITIDTCTRTLCFTTDMRATGMHSKSTMVWHVDFGDGAKFDTSVYLTSSGVKTLLLTKCHQYGAAGTYTVTLSATPIDAPCMKQFKIVIPPFNKVSFTATNTCLNGTSIFTGTATYPTTTWFWDFGDATTVSGIQSPTHVYSSPGTYSVKLITTYNSCPDTIKQIVTVGAIPKTNFTAPNVCFGTATCFTNQSTITTGTISGWSWDFGDPNSGVKNTSTVQNPCHTFTDTGTYNVKLAITSSLGCKDSITLAGFSVLPFPVADFQSMPVCPGNPMQFVNNSTGTVTNPIGSWDWDFGDPGSGPLNYSSIQNPSHSFGNGGTYQVTLTVANNGGCKVTVVKPAIAYLAPTALFNEKDSGCAPVCHSFKDLSQSVDGFINNWEWSFPGSDTFFSNSQNPSSICYSMPGTYDASLIVTTNYGCKDTIQLNKIIHVYPFPIANFIPVGSCDLVTLIDASTSTDPLNPVMTWDWSIPGGSPSSSTSPSPGTISYPPGLYTVNLLISNLTGCKSMVQHQVAVYGFPTAAFTTVSSCLGATTVLNNSSIGSLTGDPIASYDWSMAGGTPAMSASTNASTFYNTGGTYTVVLITTSMNGCRDTVSQQVQIYTPPIALFNANEVLCVPVCHTFKDMSICADGNIINWDWNFPGTSNIVSSTAQNPEICYNLSGSYDASLSVTTNYGCKDTISLKKVIRAYNPPKAGFCLTENPGTLREPLFDFCDQWSSDVSKWYWNFGDGSPLDSVSKDPSHSYSMAATGNDFYTFTISLQVINQQGCPDVMTREVKLEPEYSFFIPNAFTPHNKDDRNNSFYAKGRGIKEYTIWIYNRWGGIIWTCQRKESNVPWDYPGDEGLPSACQWDGTSHQQMDMQDVYAWRVQFTNVFDNVFTHVGRVTVVK